MITKFWFVVGFVVALICFEVNGETTIAATSQPPICIRHIVNFQMRVMMLLEDAESLNNYEEYFDTALRREMQYILNRLRGFARDATQADEWQRIARQYFRFYLVNICVTQAQEYAEAYSIYLRSLCEASRVSSLIENCVRPAAERMREMFNANFYAPRLADSTLFYEVTRFTRLPVVVVLSQSAGPFLRVLLRNGTCASYVEMAGGGVPANFRPAECAPHQNILNDMRNLNYALSNMLNRRVSSNVYNIPQAKRRLFGRKSDLHKYLKTTLRNLPEYKPQVTQRNFDATSDRLIRMVVRELLTNFLFSEYFWLLCHPAYCPEGDNAEADELRRQNDALYNTLMSTYLRIRARSPLLQTHYNLVNSLGACLSEFKIGTSFSLRRVYDLPNAHALIYSRPATPRMPSTEAPISVINI